MFSWLSKLLLVKEIRSKQGELHFRRWRLLATPWFSVYVHYIARSDEDHDPHTHPWDFASLIMKGGYVEHLYREADGGTTRTRYGPWDFVRHKADEAHKIELIRPTWTLVFVGKYKRKDWGYQTRNGFVEHSEYRKRKNEANSEAAA